ncbi:unnamed protein product [Dovyalis caffra]|uniref:Uncharacterized protein n=1 Tax=Dovyalis caffra TaxID=77055 RepID=A0AAV1SS59_9ROSI|nr:unnamed protein product [Dovyalis caffra]
MLEIKRDRQQEISRECESPLNRNGKNKSRALSWPLNKNLRKSKKRKGTGKIKASMKRLKSEMEKIGEQQKRIKKGQMEIREKFEEIEFECNQLIKEILLISQQAVLNQQRLNLMFKIVKAQEDKNFSGADKLTLRLHLVLPHSS